MSHYTTHVLIPSTVDTDDAQTMNAYLDKVMEPFDENKPGERRIGDHYSEHALEEAMASEFSTEIKHLPPIEFLQAYTGRDAGDITVNPDGGWDIWSTYNMNSKWDWWTIGGRWKGFFFGTSDCVTIPEAIQNYNDKQDMRRVELELEYDRFEKAVEGLSLISWEEIQALYDDENIDDARTAYHAQEWVEAARRVMKYSYYLPETYYMVGNGGRKAFIDKGASTAVVPYSLIDLEGVWHAKGEMLMFGMSDDNKEQGAWDEQYARALATAPLNSSVVCLDLHI